MYIKRSILATSIALLPCLGSNALAEEGLILEEVIVTAQRRAESVQDIPLAVTALDASMLDDRGISTIAGLVGTVPGMHYGQSGSNTRITIRGIGTEQTTVTGDPGVAFHIDGVYQARSSAGHALLYDLLRVEVLRGPQGTLYGRNATGGSVNLISNPPDENFGGDIEVQVGNYDQRRLRGVLNSPLGSEKWLSRLSVQYEKRDGYYEDLTPGADDLEDRDALDLRAQLMYRPNFDLDATLILNYGNNKGAGYGYAAEGPYPLPPPIFVPPKLAEATPNPLDPFKIRTNAIADRDNSRQGATFTVNWDFGPAVLKSITAWQDNEVDIFRDLDASDADILNENSYQDSTQYSQELQLTSDGTGSLEWVAGLYFFTEESDVNYWLNDTGEGLSTFPFFPTIDVGLTDPTYFGNNSIVETDVFGAYGQASYTIADTVKLTAGLRYSRDEKDADILRKEFTQPESTTFKKEGEWDSTTWKLGADWFVTDDSMLYASVSTGFKSGGFLQIEDADPYDEEEIIAWEIGSKNRFLNNRLQANISAYYYEYTDMQLRTIRDLNSIVTNAGESEIKGIEIEVVARPIGNLELTGAYGYMDAEFTDYFNDDPHDGKDELLDLSGNRLPRSPENTLNLSVAYTWDFNAGSLTSSLFYYWADEVYFSAFNRADASEDDYHRTDINVTFNSAGGSWYVTAAARNLEDDEVASDRAPGDATLGLPDNAQWNPPRTYTLAVGYYF